MIPEIPKRCLVCGESLTLLPQVSCPHCATPHHQKCWDYNGGCAVYGCNNHNAGNVPALFSDITSEERDIIYNRLAEFFHRGNQEFYFPEQCEEMNEKDAYYLFLPLVIGLIIVISIGCLQLVNANIFPVCVSLYLIFFFSLVHLANLRWKSISQITPAGIDELLKSAINNPVKYDKLLSFTWRCIEEVRDSKKKIATIRSMIPEMKAKENGDIE